MGPLLSFLLSYVSGFATSLALRRRVASGQLLLWAALWPIDVLVTLALVVVLLSRLAMRRLHAS